MYLRSHIAYTTAINMLIIPHSKIIKNIFRKIGSKFPTIIQNNMFEDIQRTEKHSKNLAGKIHNKPGVPYEGGQLISFFTYESNQPAKRVLALAVAPLMRNQNSLLD